MMKKLKLSDISRDKDDILSDIDLEKLVPLPPPYDKIEELPGIKPLTEEQRERLLRAREVHGDYVLPEQH